MPLPALRRYPGIRSLARRSSLTVLMLGLLPLAACAQTGHTANTSALPPRVEKALNNAKIDPDALSLVKIPLNAGGSTQRLNADLPVSPASTMKVLTTYAALELLGPAYRWRTRIYGDGQVSNGVLNGNLYVQGGGDPALTMERLWLLLRQLRSAGIRQVKGDLILDQSYFRMPPKVAFDDDGEDPYEPYLVGPDALLINFKSLQLSARNLDGRVQVNADPPLDILRIDNRLTGTAQTPCSDAPNVHYTPTDTGQTLTLVAAGSLARGCSAHYYLSVLDHFSYGAAAVRGLWKELGGSIQGGNRQAKVPLNATLLASSRSPELAEVIRDVNKFSNNTMAKQLFLSIGARYRTSVDADDGQAAQRAIRNWLGRKGINSAGLVLENGSGLSRNERISANQMAAILQAAWRSPYFAEFIASLPLAGVDGTMHRRLASTEMAGRAHIKTGTLKNVRAIAGFTRDRKGGNWVLVAILNSAHAPGASALLDDLLLDLYRHP